MGHSYLFYVNIVYRYLLVFLKFYVIYTHKFPTASKFSHDSLDPATASAKDFEHTSLQGHSKAPVLGLRFSDSGRGTKYRLSMAERLRQARLHSDFLTSEDAESTAAVQQTYVPLRLSMSASVPRKERVEKSQHVRVANP